MARVPRILLVVLVMVLVVALVGWAQTGAKKGGAKAEKAAAAKGDAKQGEAIFQKTCATCHGKDASGNTPVGKNLKIKDLRSEEVQKQTDDQLFDLIAKGKPPMAAYEKTLGHAKIHDVIAYIRTVKK